MGFMGLGSRVKLGFIGLGIDLVFISDHGFEVCRSMIVGLELTVPPIPYL